MRHYLYRGILVLLMVGGSSCATHRDAIELRNELESFQSATDSRLAAIEKSLAAVDSLVREQRTTTLEFRATIGAQDQAQRENLSILEARQEEINYQLRELLSRLQAIQLYGGVSTRPPETSTAPQQSPAPETAPPSTAVPQSLPATTPQQPSPATSGIRVLPEDLYHSAADDLARGNYTLAESRLLTFLIQFPDNEYADDAQYGLAEAALGQDKLNLAIQEADKLREKYPDSPKIPAVLLIKGQAQMRAGDTEHATATLQSIIATYPDAEEAVRAQELLEPR